MANWLTVSSCACTTPFVAGPHDMRRHPHELQRWTRVHDWVSAAADLNEDGRVDVRDVELFEQAYDLSGELSKRMRSR